MELAVIFSLITIIFVTVLNNLCTSSWNIKPNLMTDIRGSSEDMITFSRVNNKTYPSGFKIVINDEENIIIGSINRVYVFTLNGYQMIDIIEWAPAKNDVILCKSRMRTEWECQNHIRVLVKTSANQLFICGTNAFKPQCRTYNKDMNSYSKSFVGEQNGIGMCSFDPNYNNTAILAGDWLVSGTVADFAARDALIYGKSIEPTDDRPKLRTEQFASDKLNEPNFVQSFEFEDKIFFFFRETAVEAINCKKTVYSRVGRLCKNDQGGKFFLQESWSSFFKSRLNCSVPGDFPFYFDEIQSTSEIGHGSYMHLFSNGYIRQETDLIYAVFNTPENSIHGSAICAFSFQDIIKTFHGPFKEKKFPHSNWLPLPEAETPKPHPAKYCANDSVTDLATLNFIKAHPLMDNAVNAFGGKPVFVQTSFEYTLTVIAVDWQVRTPDNKTYDVLFIGTTDGRVLKTTNIFHNTNRSRNILIEDVQIFNNKDPIVNLKIQKNEIKLLVVSKSEIKSIPLQRCHMKKTCSECIGLQDPYCSWNNELCEFSKDGLQNIDAGRHKNCTVAPRTAEVFATNMPNFSTDLTITIIFVFIALFTGFFIGIPIGCYLDYKYCVYR